MYATNQNQKKFIGTLLMAGARNLKLSKKQEMKLREWIIPSITDEFEFTTEPLKIKDARILIDQWESDDLEEGSYKHYYVKRNSNGKVFFWDRFTFIMIALGGVLGLIIRSLYIK